MKYLPLLCILTLIGCSVESARETTTKSLRPRTRPSSRVTRIPWQPAYRRRIGGHDDDDDDDGETVYVAAGGYNNEEPWRRQERRRSTKPWFISKTNRTTTSTTTDAQSLQPNHDAATHFTVKYDRYTRHVDDQPADFTKKPVYHKQAENERNGSTAVARSSVSTAVATFMLTAATFTRHFHRRIV